MKRSKFSVILLIAIVLVFALSACNTSTATSPYPAPATDVFVSTTAPTETSVTVTKTEVVAPTTTEATVLPGEANATALTFNTAAWQYDSEHDIYYQIGVSYVAKPEAPEYETLGIYVPGAYVNASANGDGTYTLTVNNAGSINGYTAETAPIVFPVNTPGYSAQAAPTAYDYDEASNYLAAGFVYVKAGMRGRENGYDSNGTLIYNGGAPWGVTDLKAAVRYIRYNSSVLPGDTERIFVFGMSGGGAQSAIMGASGDSELYFPYLQSIGAAMVDAGGTYISDAITGVMAWCPVTSLDYADAAYEWNMGQYSTVGTRADTTWTSALSDDLAVAYATYINHLGLVDENGNALTLEESAEGIYAAGSYYEYLKSVIEESLNNFLAETTFPYTAKSGNFPGVPGGGNPPAGGTPPAPGGGFPSGAPGGNPPSGSPPEGGFSPVAPGSGNPPAGGTLPAPGGGFPSGTPGEGGVSESTPTYETVQDYINALNADAQWIIYDATTNTATITSIAAFVNSQKNPTKAVGAFDDLNRKQAENDLFGNDASDALHFDAVLANLLSTNADKYAGYADWDGSYVEAYHKDLAQLDKLGNSIEYRLNMYNPMYYLTPYYSGYQTSTVAKNWRINTGITQGDTANTVELNLALALENFTGVESVEFTTVWAQGHTMAERSGDATTNFITWINSVLK